MAVTALQKFIRRGLAVRLQSVEGTAVVPDPATHGVSLYNGQSGTEFDAVEEPRDRAVFSGDDFGIANERAFVEGEFRLYPPTVPGASDDTGTPECNVLLLPGGMTSVKNALARTTRYNPISDAISIATAYWWQGGTHKQITDARNAISSLSVEIGMRVKGTVRLQGTFASIEDEALPTITVTDTLGPIVTSTNSRTRMRVAGGSWMAANSKALTVDFGTELTSKEYTELKVNSIDDRKGSFTWRLAKTDLTEFNPWAIRTASQLLEAYIRVRGSDGRYTMLGVRGKIRDIREVDIDKDYGWEITGPCIASSAGGDEFYIEFGNVSLALQGTLDNGTDAVAYDDVLTIAGEYTAPLAFTISAGTLPTGLSINATTGAITGTPSVVDTFTFTIRAESAEGYVATSAQSVVISA